MKKQNRIVSWTPVTDNLKKMSAIVDNELEKGLKELKAWDKAHLFGLKKRSGYELRTVMFLILIWPLLTLSSLNFFCGNRLSAYIKGGKDVPYDFLKRRDVNWRGWRFHVAKRFYYKKHELKKGHVRAAVFDDALKHRRGKKVNATAVHYDHSSGRNVTGREVLEMGMATAKGYVPLDSRICIAIVSHFEKTR